MAAKHFYRQGFLLLLFNFISTAALEKRFSDFKRCADEECSMLLVRGKAMKDFSGPDCRFLTVKKSETVYVYYKLSGRRNDIWAGSVGSSFGYFPNEILAVNHHYTDKELEVAAEETDFVCFDTGFDKFDNYDIDSLIGSFLEGTDGETTKTPDLTQAAEDAQKETQPSADEASDSEKQTELHDVSEDFDDIPDDENASLPESDVATESPSKEEVEPDTAATPDDTKRAVEDTQVEQKSVLENIASETKDTPTEPEVESVPKDDIVPENEPVSVSEAVQIPELKTTFGTTFDAVTTDDEITKNVTPYEEEEEESEYVENHPEDDIDVKAETLLLSVSEEPITTPESESFLKEHESPPTHDDKPEAEEEKTVWTSLGDAVFSVVTGGERTADVFSSEEDDDDEVEEAASKTPQSFEEQNEDVEEPLSEESPKEPENIEPVSFDRENEDEGDGEVIGPEGALEETLKPTDEPIHHQTKESTITVDTVSHDGSAIPEAQNSDMKTTIEAIEQKEEQKEASKDAEVNNDTDPNIAMEHSEDLDNELEENKTVMDQELTSTKTEIHQDTSTEVMQSKDLDSKDDEKTVDDHLPEHIHDHSLTDSESNNSQPEVSVEEPEVHEEWKDEEQKDEEKEELLEDENALSFSQSDHADSKEPSPETTPPTLSTPEPKYSDSVLRLTLLRDHFTEDNMMKIQKLLGLKNLFKVEAMFSDLDTELQATRLSHTGSTHDIESALEGILEASENTILDEIEKMLDGRDTKDSYDQQQDTSNVDEETEILDDFQELAFSLRQKYSTASDSTPLASDSAPDTDQDEHELNADDAKEDKVDTVPEAESDDNLTVTDQEEPPAQTKEEQMVLDEVHGGADISVEEDGGHFNKNKDNQPSFSASNEIQKVPQTTLENPLDMGLGVEVEHSSSGSFDSIESVSDIPDEEVGLLSTGIVYMGCILSMMKSKIAGWTIEPSPKLPRPLTR